MRKRRALTPFGLSFLDVMCCGFGAVVLLVMILNSQILERRHAKAEDLREAFDRAVTLEQFARDDLAATRRKVEATRIAEGDLQLKVDRLQQQIEKERSKGAQVAQKAQELRRTLEALAQQNRALAEKAQKETEKRKAGAAKPGTNLVGYTGDGRRQYLTGLKMGGDRTLILVDVSASMLDEKIVNIVRWKLLPAASRRAAPKWQRAVRSFRWLIANLQAGKHFQAYAFNEHAVPLIAGSAGKWLDTGNVGELNGVINAVRAIAPEGGTSLTNALEVATTLSPRPDSIILITDGLPTQGRQPTNTGLVTADERLDLFDTALKRMPSGIPVNTLLLPMEGDPTAAEAFWRLAISTHGSFITPSRDWP